MTAGIARPTEMSSPNSVTRTDFSCGGGYAQPAIHPRRQARRVDRTRQIAYSLARSRIRADVSAVMRPVAGAGQE